MVTAADRAAATIAAFYLGLSYGGAAAGQTMAFSTLCLSRLFHGFSCKSQHPVLLTRMFWNNRALLGAFAAGSLLLGLVLFINSDGQNGADDAEYKLAQTIAAFLGRHMES